MLMGGENRGAQSRITEGRNVRRREAQKGTGGKIAAVCRITGTLLILAVILLCSTLVLPGVFGWHMYNVISGSMEPALKVGSLIYIHEDLPEDVQEDDIIAFYSIPEVRPSDALMDAAEDTVSDKGHVSGGASGYDFPDDNSIITHRVVKNNVVSGNFRTKGDANDSEDPMPVDYDYYIGRVKLSVPYMGAILTIMTSLQGKIAAGCVVALGVVLNLIGSRQKEESE